jgi:pimeloyl-ACP methyl ester carboxylesterase
MAKHKRAHLLRIFMSLVVILFGISAFAWWFSKPATPDGFYQTESNSPVKPGILLRQQGFSVNVPADAIAWRILYTTTRQDGSPATASAVVMVARKFLKQKSPVIAWTHGTTGVMPGCAPSLLDDPFANIPALNALLDNGWIYVATDYVGQGTEGPHPYLIGAGEARSALDSIRAAQQMAVIKAENRTVVWGHSQGGHAALWTGIIAPSYAPDLDIFGVAAISPASDLPSLIDANQNTPIGRIMSAFVLRSYEAAYADVDFNTYVPWHKRWLSRDISGRCLSGRKTLFSIAETLAAGNSIFQKAPSSGPLAERLAENTPKTPLPQPVLIAQGLADDLVLPAIQAKFVRDYCQSGASLQYVTYTKHDHLSIVAPDSPLTADLLKWTQDRLDRKPPTTNCTKKISES